MFKKGRKKTTQNNPEALRALNPLSMNSVNTVVERFLNNANITKVTRIETTLHVYPNNMFVSLRRLSTMLRNTRLQYISIIYQEVLKNFTLRKKKGL